MMNAYLLNAIIETNKEDKDYHSARQFLHENYEWLESYCRGVYRNGDSSFDDFIRDKGYFFWNTAEIKEFAREIVSIECVGSSNNEDYAQNQEIAKATFYLRYFSNLFESENIPNCSDINCRSHKLSNKFCSKENGKSWTKKQQPYSSFNALMYILRQVRNNLFHGHKMTLMQEERQRDKIIVTIAAKTTAFLLENLILSEK